MTTPILNRRIFRTDDASMISFANVTVINATNHVAALTAFDAAIDAAFVNDLNDAITIVLGMETDNQVIDSVAQNTMDVETHMVVCRDTYHQLKYFVDLAFPEKHGRRNEFGFNDYDNVRNDHEKMAQFMNNLFVTAQKFDTELISHGYLPIRITQLGERSAELAALIAIQEQSKGERNHLTNERIKALNEVYRMVVRICTVGKLQFANDYGIYQLFLLPWGSGTSSHDQEIEDTITGLEIKNVSIPGLTLTTELTLSNLGAFDLHFYFATTIDADTGNAPTILGPGAIEIVAAGNIGMDGSHVFLNLKKPTGDECEYRVEWV